MKKAIVIPAVIETTAARMRRGPRRQQFVGSRRIAY
jgi:hypothetical protein